MHQNWYYNRGGEQHGPISDAELKALAEDGFLLPTDLVWRSGLPNWVPIQSIKGFCMELDPVCTGPSPLPPGFSQPSTTPPVIGTNGFAVASLVLGIVWCYWVGSLLSIIFGHIALSQIKKSNGYQNGRGMALTGLVLGWAAVGFLIGILIIGMIAGIGQAIQSQRQATRQEVQETSRQRAQFFISSGNAWYGRKEYNKAIADFTDAIRLDPEDTEAYCMRGLAWYDKHEYDIALADYHEAIRLKPGVAWTYVLRSRVLLAKGKYDEAMTDCNEAIRLDPQNAEAYFNRGVAWMNKSNTDRAMFDFNEAIRLDPKDAAAYGNRGTIWDITQEYGRALADFSEAIRLDPKEELWYFKMAWLLATCPNEQYRDGKRAVELASYACELTRWTRYSQSLHVVRRLCRSTRLCRSSDGTDQGDRTASQERFT